MEALRTVWVSWRNSSGHQDVLRGEGVQSAEGQLSYRLSSLLVGGAGGGHPGLVGVGQVLHKPIQVVPHHRCVDVGISEALRPPGGPSDHDDAVRVVVRHGASRAGREEDVGLKVLVIRNLLSQRCQVEERFGLLDSLHEYGLCGGRLKV